MNIEIIKKTRKYVVINKPAGLLVHPSASSNEKTLSDYLLEKYPQIKKVGEDSNRYGIVHRLDKEVSGLMVIALKQKTYLHLKEQFQNRRVEKDYIGLVCGHMPESTGTISFPIKRSNKGYKMAAVPKTYEENNEVRDGEKLREAITHYQVENEWTNFSLLKLQIETGRTHQIRVHCLALNTPLAGDNLYSTKNSLKVSKKLNLNRVFLVANKLSFYNQRKKKKSFNIDIPKELQEKLDLLQ
ncbi:RNA pseudouridine synthase [Patescibacteria group bacterium]|nr:RNA pseudouridine synthase [Patescibacteria group bacterium]